MRHYDYPGNEEDANRTRTFQAKLASSIANLYRKQRAGLTAYWGTGWGHSPQDNLTWTRAPTGSTSTTVTACSTAPSAAGTSGCRPVHFRSPTGRAGAPSATTSGA